MIWGICKIYVVIFEKKKEKKGKFLQKILKCRAKLLQMPTDSATQSLRDIPRACVLHAQTRRNLFCNYERYDRIEFLKRKKKLWAGAGRGCVMIEDVSADIEWKRANITVDEGQTERGKATNDNAQTQSNKRKR